MPQAKEQAKEAAKAKAEAARLKNLERKEKVWAQGAKDTSAKDAAEAKAQEKAAQKAANKKLLEDEEGVSPAPKKSGQEKKKCPDCGKKSAGVGTKKGCQNCKKERGF